MYLAAFDLNVTWFILVAVLLTGYAILDGFDLGVGMLHLSARNDMDRRIMLNSIAPVWDGNEVWLLTGGGAMFAAFPNVYATVFSGFYLALMLLLAALIMRATAIEFRSKQPNPGWRSNWDVVFCISSLVATLLLGVALGNIIRGVPIDARGEFAGTFFGLLNPYSLIVGVATVVLFALHGGIYAALKTEGALHTSMRQWVSRTLLAFAVLFVVFSAATLTMLPHAMARLKECPWMGAVALVCVLAMYNISREMRRGRPFLAFVSSAVLIASLMTLVAITIFPNLVLSSPEPANSLNIHNAASSSKTLGIMLLIALIGMPLVIGYTTFIYWTFRGKVKIDRLSY